jgi:glutathione S-transferase
MPIHEPDTAIRMTRLLRAAPATVFEALIRPELLQRWMCPEHLTVARVETDPRPGGRFRIEMRKPDGAIYPATGTYTEVLAPKLLAFTWTWEGDEHPTGGIETHIRIELSERGEHTFLLMTHFGLPTESDRTSHQAGWTSVLNQLERLFEPRSTS